MSTTPPPDQPDRPTEPNQPGMSPSGGGAPAAPSPYTIATPGSIARLPFPGNAELVVYLLVWILVTLIWIISEDFDEAGYVAATVALTFGYMLSRGIAKASRVLEQ